jgi:serine/threonine-protein kinase
MSVETQTPKPGDLTGTVLLDRYKILKQLGEGGMGTVYLAEHTTIQKRFAIKVLSGDFAHKPDLVERFLQEARAASMISQENVVEISDFGDTPDGSVFFVMEHLVGEDLSGTLKTEGALPWARVQGIMLQVCDALAAAHDAGIIHRDMKPENCFRISRGDNDDFIKVLDFGIAKVTDESGEGKGLTRTGMIFGTPEYMSPEQAQGQKVDHRVDVYAAGVIMYELLTGRVPFTGQTFMSILTKHMFEVPEAPSVVNPDAGITAEVEAIVLKAMQKDRAFRFDDMRAMKQAIMAIGTGAAAVQVVHENIARPDGGQMAFVPGPNQGTHPPQHGQAGQASTYPPPGHGTYPGAGTRPPQGGTYPPHGTFAPGGHYAPNRRRRSPVAAVAAGVALLGLAGGGAYFAVGMSETPAPAVAAAEEDTVEEPTADPAPPAPEPIVVPEKKVIDQAVPTVSFQIETEVPARIVDASDGALFGMTNDGKGFAIEKSSVPVRLALVAEGYERFEFDTVPNRDKEFHKQLVKLKTGTSRRRTGGGTSAKAAAPVPASDRHDKAPPSETVDTQAPKPVPPPPVAKPKPKPETKKKKEVWVPERLDKPSKKKSTDLLDPF